MIRILNLILIHYFLSKNFWTTWILNKFLYLWPCRFSAMPIYPCLLCLSSLDKDNRPLPAKKVTIKAQIVRLYDLLVPQHRTSSPHQSIIAEIEDTDGFKLCQNCFLSAKEIEKIKQQVSQLEEKIVKKVQELRKTVSNSFQKDETIGESLQKVRKSLLSPGLFHYFK